MLKRVAVLIGASYKEFLDLMVFSMHERGSDVDTLSRNARVTRWCVCILSF